MAGRVHSDVKSVAECLLNGSSFVAGDDGLAALASVLAWTELDAGTPLYLPGEPPAGMWIISAGLVEVSQGRGSHRQVVGLLKRGDIVADLYLILGVPPPLAARTLRRTNCWFLAADDFRELVKDHPTLALAWLSNLAGRLAHSQKRVLEILGQSLSQRLARLLIEEAVDGELILSQQTVAQMLGAHRTSVNHCLKRFEKAGLIRLSYGRVLLEDEAALREIAHPSSVRGLS